jgi:hypothetical protein
MKMDAGGFLRENWTLNGRAGSIPAFGRSFQENGARKANHGLNAISF